MAEIFPFRGYLPRLDIVSQVVSKPFDKYSIAEVEQIVNQNPVSFLNIIKPDLVKGSNIDSANLRYNRKKFEQFVQDTVFQKAAAPSFYIYRQEKPEFSYTGVIASIASADYRNGIIKIHEQTLAAKEEKLKDYLKLVGINAEPVLFTYPNTTEIDLLIDRLVQDKPLFHFEANRQTHTLWSISAAADVHLIRQAFSKIEHFYVADGHHRSASSVLLTEELQTQYPEAGADSAWRNFMGIYFPHHDLQLFAFNRLLKDTGGMGKREIIEKLSLTFTVELCTGDDFNPHEKQEFSMYIDGQWYMLRFKVAPPDASAQLDADLLNEYILAPVFGINDLRHDHRVDFVPGPLGSQALREKVDKGKALIAFGLYPVSFKQFFEFSDLGKTMPPKSTWFEPKLLNGLVVYDLEIPNEHNR